MADFGINEMQEMQKALQDKYKDKWEPICAEIGQNKLLWMIGELGEVIDIIKQNGGTKACNDRELRKHLVEEMADVLMYYNDVMLCYGISADELKQAYSEKFERNMKRWYIQPEKSTAPVSGAFYMGVTVFGSVSFCSGHRDGLSAYRGYNRR